tara:strand:+ start:353 stop:487 length:135 start_codon:yes stop_codon:yes gene_type:complete
MYQHLMFVYQTSRLTAKQIREGWLKHVKLEEENFYGLPIKGLLI